MTSITGLTNTGSLNTMNQMKKHTANAADATAALSSGSRLTKASRDSASAAISALMKSNISVLNQNKINANNAIGLLQVATGGLNNIKELATSLKTLAVQATNGSLDDSKRLMINNEFQKTKLQIDDIASRTRWNGVSLLNGANNGGTVAAAANMQIINSSPTPIASTMANTLNANSRGFISGEVKDVSVEAIGNTYNVTIKVGNQTFMAKAATPAVAGTLNLVSTTDPGSLIMLDFDPADISGITDAATFEDALKTVLNVGAGLAPASFQSAANAPANGLTGLTEGANTEPGTYAFRYDANSNKLTLTNGTQIWTKEITETGAPQSITFDNGITAALDNTFVLGTSIDQVILEVSANTNAVSLDFQVAENVSDVLTVIINGASLSSLNLTDVSVETALNAKAAQPFIDEALNQLNASYSTLGAQQKRLESTITNLDTQVENLTAARSSYEDADIAETMSAYVQASTMATLAQTALSFNNQMTQQLARIVQS
jgi:flagellin